MTKKVPQEMNVSLAEECDRYKDAYWAQHEPQVENLYGGQWVVAYESQIVAHGTDPAAVIQEAARLTSRRPEDLVVCAIPHPNNWLAETTRSSWA